MLDIQEVTKKVNFGDLYKSWAFKKLNKSWCALLPVVSILKFKKNWSKFVKVFTLSEWTVVLVKTITSKPILYFYISYFLLVMCKCLATFGEKWPWQYMAATCTSDVWDHIIFYTQYVVAALPKPNFLHFYTYIHPFYFSFHFCFK